MSLRVVIPPHALISHWLSILRDASTPSAIYSTALEELGRWLTYEAIREWLPYRLEKVKTKHTEMKVQIIDAQIPLLTVPIRSGGFQLWMGARKVLPNSQLCLKGVPSSIEKKAGIIIFIDEIASGQKAIEILSELNTLEINEKRIRVITTIASSPGLKNIAEMMPNLTIYAACIDPDLSENGEITPGIGNPSQSINTIF